MSTLLLVLAAAGAAGALLAHRALCHLRLSRSVLVHLPPPLVWDFVRRLPNLLQHARLRDRGHLSEFRLERGAGETAGSIWRAAGRLDGEDYWAEVEIARSEPERAIGFELRRDALGTARGLRRHSGTLTLEPIAPASTKMTWSLRADLRGLRLPALRLVAPERLRALLLDPGLRSVKLAIETAAAEEKGAGPQAARRPARPAAPPPRPPEATT